MTPLRLLAGSGKTRALRWCSGHVPSPLRVLALRANESGCNSGDHSLKLTLFSSD